MATRKPAAPNNEPIVLSGCVFLDGILAEDNPRLRMPAKLNVGDIKLHNVNRAGERPRFGAKVEFAGFIVASVWNGKKFRRLLLRQRAAIESTYVGPVGRRERAVAVLRHLSTLVRREVIWYARDSGYEAPHNGAVMPPPEATPAVQTKTPATAQTAPLAVTQSQPVTPAISVAPAPATAVSVTVTVDVKRDGETTVRTTTEAQHVVARQRRRRKSAADQNQLPLFPDET